MSESSTNLLTNEDCELLLSLNESELSEFLLTIPRQDLEAIQQRLARYQTPQELAETSLSEFVRQAWPIVEPTTPFVPNWHLEGICRHLEAVARGTIAQLLINVPPGCMKSLLVNVFWPTWVWGPYGWPQARFFFASYGQELSTRDSRKCRLLIGSPWYQSLWGTRFHLEDDQNQKRRYDNDKLGWRIASSVGGMATGEHPDFVCVDDPHKPEEAESDVTRQAVTDWWDSTMSSRGASRQVRRVVIMQRLHEDDLAGHLIAEGGWEQICLPMEFEPERMTATSIGWTDPRTQPGELLWPALFDATTVSDLARKLRPHRAAGQLQQRPSALGGERFRREWFQILSPSELPLDLAHSGRAVRYWDKAGTERGGDFTVGVLIVQHASGWYVMDVQRGQWSAFRRNELICETASRDSRNWRYYTVHHEQEGGSGGKESADLTNRQLAGYTVHADRVTGKKESRWDPWEAQLEAGAVRLLRAPWNRDFIDEHCAAPHGKHDDQVDAAAGAFLKLTQRRRLVVA